MTATSRIARLLLAATLAACLALPGAGAVLANGIGDLYVAVPEGVDEMYLLEERFVTRVELAQGPDHLAFTPDGRSLYAADGERHLYKIDIESISLAETITLDGTVAGIAHPRGDALLIAMPDTSELAVLIDGDDTPAATLAMPGPVTLVAADRREARAIAAEAGKPWVAIVESMAGSVKEVGIGGEVVAIAIARAEGAAYVATTNPDQVVRVDLAAAEVDWTAKLTAPPTAVTAIADAAVVAVGPELVRAADGKAATWVAIPAAGVDLVTSDEGQFVYASTADHVYAVSVAEPGEKPSSTLDMSESTPAAIAAVPRASSLVKDGSTSAGGTGEGTGEGTGNGTGEGSSDSNGDTVGVKDRAPATDTESPVRIMVGGRDVTPFLLVAGAVTVVVLFGSRFLFRRLAGES